MSMIGSFGLVSSAEVAALLATPETVEALIHPEDRDIYEDERFYCVEKDWHAIHFAINRETWSGSPPLDFIVAGGTEVGDIDVGYGPARVFTPAQLASIVAGLRTITDDHLRANFTEEALAEADEPLYPGYGAEDVDGVIESCRGLQTFLEGGAKQGLGLIIWCD
jgi:hypothetical protein